MQLASYQKRNDMQIKNCIPSMDSYVDNERGIVIGAQRMSKSTMAYQKLAKLLQKKMFFKSLFLKKRALQKPLQYNKNS